MPANEWHGFAMQEARSVPSTGFRRRYAAWRVTLERPKVTKGLLPRQTARFAGSLLSSNGSDGSLQTALWPTPSLASAKARFEPPCSRAKSGSSSARPDPIWPLCRLRCVIIPDGAPDPL